MFRILFTRAYDFFFFFFGFRGESPSTTLFSK